ncbi:Uncharacterized protein TCM_033439 [Theobroma cacao]|uniref:Uncharacterized protein n=1 Tax=Theobroma cacao TaxID=3641 RepID=A0A061FBU6_THECC|nr:Uncharacterized protein TCM_033439 [Theobroma cacao]
MPLFPFSMLEERDQKVISRAGRNSRREKLKFLAVPLFSSLLGFFCCIFLPPSIWKKGSFYSCLHKCWGCGPL